jgi:hypothetical protein
MATLSNATMSVAKNASDATKVNVTLKYTLTPSNIERLAGTVFNSSMQIWGEDGTTDQLRITVGDGQFAVSTATPSSGVVRTRTVSVSKSTVNEDPETSASGSEVGDEIFLKAIASYAANAPTPLPTIAPAFSSVVGGVWK